MHPSITTTEVLCPRMVPTIESKNVSHFYNQIAEFYDEMIDFHSRIEREKEILRNLVETFHIKTALDVGAGSGVHSIALAQLGVNVEAVDPSQQMVQRLRENAQQMGVDLSTHVGEISGIAFREKYDAVFCVGNTLPHFRNKKELYRSLKVMHAVLAAEGVLILQFLNYSRFLCTKKRILSVKEGTNALYIRFNDYSKNSVHFNVLTIRKKKSPPEYSLFSVPLSPWKISDVVPVLRTIGFRKIRTYSSLKFDTYLPRQSRDAVLIATCGSLRNFDA